MEYFIGDGLPYQPPTSALDGLRVTYHHDTCGDEWVVRIHHPGGMQSVAGCPGEQEAKLVAAALSSVIAVADVTWTIKSGGSSKAEEVQCRNLLEFDGMRDTTSLAIGLIREFIS